VPVCSSFFSLSLSLSLGEDSHGKRVRGRKKGEGKSGERRSAVLASFSRAVIHIGHYERDYVNDNVVTA